MSDNEPAVEGEVVSSETPREFTKTKHDDTIVELLEAAFHNAFNITEACQYAGISRVTYYEWLADDDIFSYRMSVAQAAVLKKAKQNVTAAIQAGDPVISLKVLTLRDPDFKPRGTLEVEPGDVKVEEKLKEFMDDSDDGAYIDTGADDAASAEPATPSESEGGAEVASSPPDIS